MQSCWNCVGRNQLSPYLTAFQIVSSPIAYIITCTPLTKSVWPHLLLYILWNSWLFIWLMTKDYFVILVTLEQVLLQRAWYNSDSWALCQPSKNLYFTFYLCEFSSVIFGNTLCPQSLLYLILVKPYQLFITLSVCLVCFFSSFYFPMLQ